MTHSLQYSPTSIKRPSSMKRPIFKVPTYLSVNCCRYLYSTATSIKRPWSPFCCRKCIIITSIKGTLSRTFFGFFSKKATKLRLSIFNHAGNSPRTKREGYLANCLKKQVTLNSFHQFFQTTRTELEKVRLTFSS